MDLSQRKRRKRAIYNNCKGVVNPMQNSMFTYSEMPCIFIVNLL